jgi:NAD(P)-dependent dehydrogenase (short-subunit alcohol dehydrogenase family)
MKGKKYNSAKKFKQEEIEKSIEILNYLAQNTEDIVLLPRETRENLMRVAGRLSRPDKNEQIRRQKEAKKILKQKIREIDKEARANTGIRQARNEKIFTAPMQLVLPEAPEQLSKNELTTPRNCYVCKAEYTKVHFFYDAMCPECADYNYQKRFQSADLTGQTVLITGSRLKIGYQATLMMLRAGAQVIATTRFPHDSAIRFAKENDYPKWCNRLHIYGLDLRHIPSVELFTHFIENQYNKLDVIINNAAQTVRRPAGFYAHMLETETKNIDELPEKAQQLLKNFEFCKNELNALEFQVTTAEKALPVSWHGRIPGIGIRASAKLSQIPYSFDNSLSSEEVFPEGKLDADLQQIDLRTVNSWRLKLGEIPTPEMLEVQLVNSIAPFVLINRLVNIMRRENTGKKHIVNVSAMEGKFYRFKKADRHPHTNMAKAALNMMTHTSASDFAKDGIYMNAVDTGWVTDEDPIQLSSFKQQAHDFQPPLDIVDGAARVLDPLFDGINSGKHMWGKFLKDYKPIDW